MATWNGFPCHLRKNEVESLKTELERANARRQHREAQRLRSKIAEKRVLAEAEEKCYRDIEKALWYLEQSMSHAEIAGDALWQNRCRSAVSLLRGEEEDAHQYGEHEQSSIHVSCATKWASDDNSVTQWTNDGNASYASDQGFSGTASCETWTDDAHWNSLTNSSHNGWSKQDWQGSCDDIAAGDVAGGHWSGWPADRAMHSADWKEVAGGSTGDDPQGNGETPKSTADIRGAKETSSKPERSLSPSLPRSAGGDTLMGTCIDCWVPAEVYAALKLEAAADCVVATNRSDVSEPNFVFKQLFKIVVDNIESNVLKLARPLPKDITGPTGISDPTELLSWMQSRAPPHLLDSVVSSMVRKRKPDRIRLEFAEGPNSQFCVNILLCLRSCVEDLWSFQAKKR